MNAPAERWEPYRVILDLEGLEDGILDRIDDLETTFEQIEMAGGMAHGQLQKCLTKNPGKRIVQARNNRHASNKRNFGWESLGKALKGTGLALVLVVDDERFAAIKTQLAKRRRRAQPANAGSKRPAWLFTKKKAREMGKKRFSIMTPAELKRHQRKAGKASARARQIRQREMETAA
jgi:hypothetical protein